MMARGRFGALVAAVLPIPLSVAFATLPACDRSPAAMFAAADAVIDAQVSSSRRWASGPTTLHLVATYKVRDVFKGTLVPGESVIVTDTCLDMPMPGEVQGTPSTDSYCLGGSNLSLTGVDSATGKALPPDGDAGWILFLREDRRRGAPEQTWVEVEAVGYGSSCDVAPGDLSPAERRGFDRMMNGRTP